MSYKHILVAADFTDESKILLNKAVDLAKDLQAKLSVVHVEPDLSDFYTGMIEIDLKKRANDVEHELVIEMKAFLETLNYPITEHRLCNGAVAKEVEKTITNINADLLVLGQHKTSSLFQLFFSATEPLIHDMPCDITLIKL
ncbi:universal stress protein [Vibrio sp. SS-MA-C1-2]|uniref:universal stress protein n=1 Tax=Vibrio sp. SS-MA-C1-2 TaxID=2908646 RepID=UPI001F1EA7F4|nr:universal stress protein [Vibrio sp. SS-MA-C1-2]UJF18373.1 universal stress protein [Vibrio sp. SS-MA-C1-2]